MNFNLYVYNKFKLPIYITQFNREGEYNNLYSTFDEKLNQANNDQITLTFSLSGKVPNEQGQMIENPYLKYLIFGNTICLDSDGGFWELVITKIEPKIGSNCTIYQFTCQDIVSYKWPRINIGYSYNTMERGGTKTLFEIAKDILHDCGLDKEWSVHYNNNHLYPNTNLKTEQITLQVEDSNPYNALVEAMNALNASMLVNFRYREIRFYQKEKVVFSGYRYRPETNLRSLSVAYDIDNLTTILHVAGGTDETGANVMLVPPIPKAVNSYLTDNELPEDGYLGLIKNNFERLNGYLLNNVTSSDIARQAYEKERHDIAEFCTIADRVPSLGQFLYNFDFFEQNGLMSSTQHEQIKNIFDVQMKAINIELKPLLKKYYNDTWEIQTKLFDFEAKIEQVNAMYYSYLFDNENERILSLDEINLLIEEASLIIDSQFKNNYYSTYGYSILLKNRDWVPEFKNAINRYNSYIKLRDESKYYYELYKGRYLDKYGIDFDEQNTADTTDEDSQKIELEGDILYYKNRFYTALQMCGIAQSFEDFYANEDSKKYPLNNRYLDDGVLSEETATSYFGIYFNILQEKLFNNPMIDYEQEVFGVYSLIQDLESQIQNLWDILYNDYSQFIYESSYVNSDELDSISLYNQAISYFEDLHHPKANYSLEIINIEDLEQIGIPNLRVNSHIRVYNEELNLNEGDALNNISYTSNELAITELSYDLRKSAIMSITVEHTIQHQNILQKLIKSIR